MKYIRVTKENIEKEHICCAISSNRDIQVISKKNWLKERFDEKGSKAFGSLLGISYYLEKRDFEQLLSGVSKVMESESAICFDYPSVDESSETRKIQMLATAAGEQMKARYSYEEMDMLLRKYGFELIEHLDAEKMTDRYFKKYNEANSEYQMRSSNGIGYVYAVKG